MTRGTWVAALVVVGAAWVGSAVVIGRLPERVPIHWNFQGVADGFGLRTTAFVLPTVLCGLLALFAALPRLSPGSFQMNEFRPTYGIIVVLTLAILATVHALALAAALGQRVDMTRFITAAVLLGLGVMGNFLGRVRRNFFVGVRVPWTLASERVWNETHRMAAWVTCGGGLLGSAVALAGYPLIALGLLVPIIAVPIAFSFVRSRQLEARG